VTAPASSSLERLLEQPGPGAGRVLGALIQALGPELLPALEYELLQVRRRLGRKRGRRHQQILRQTKELYRELTRDEVIATLRRKVEAQFAVCSQWLEAAKQACRSADSKQASRFPHLAVLAAISILRLQGAADALEIKAQTPSAAGRKSASKSRQRSTTKLQLTRALLTELQFPLGRGTRTERATIVRALAKRLNVEPHQARVYLRAVERTSPTDKSARSPT